jgi:hypothetical protein
LRVLLALGIIWQILRGEKEADTQVI